MPVLLLQIASPNYVYGIYDGDGSAFNFSGPAGSDQIERDFEDFFKANGLPSVPSVFSGRSDYAVRFLSPHPTLFFPPRCLPSRDVQAFRTSPPPFLLDPAPIPFTHFPQVFTDKLVTTRASSKTASPPAASSPAPKSSRPPRRRPCSAAKPARPSTPTTTRRATPSTTWPRTRSWSTPRPSPTQSPSTP